MCCFSRPVELVAETRIFARASEKGRQFVAYSLKLSAKQDLAMVLPIPTPADSADDAVRFISLKDYPQFFTKLNEGFPVVKAARNDGRAPKGGDAVALALPVVQVGSFEASFVPTLKDFARLDARFRLPEGTWEKLPTYKKFGFAVFKLKAGEKTIHPMAFEFPRQNPKAIFFPTVHIHDGEVHAKADFDHLLFLQRGEAEALLPDGWEESVQPPNHYMDLKKTAGIVIPDVHVYRRGIHGKQKNEDTYV